MLQLFFFFLLFAHIIRAVNFYEVKLSDSRGQQLLLVLLPGHCVQKAVARNEAHNFNWLSVEFNVHPFSLKHIINTNNYNCFT